MPTTCRHDYPALTEPDAPALVHPCIWAAYFEMTTQQVKRQMKGYRLPTGRDNFGVLLKNPAWSHAWRDRVWNKAKGEYEYKPGCRSGLSYLAIDPNVGEDRTYS